MKALSYLMIHTIKNRILQLKKKPALLVVYILCILSFGSMFILYAFTDKVSNVRTHADIRILYSVIAGIGLLFSYLYINTGLSKGGTLFSMPDVSLMFVSPISSRRILIYGLIKQMGTTMLTAVFIIFQLPNLKNAFGIEISGIFNIFIIYAIMIFFSQLVSIAVYIYSNGNQSRKNIVKGIAIVIAAFAVVLLYLKYQETGNILEACFLTVDDRIFGFLPIAGWSVMFVKAAVEYNMIWMIMSLVLYFAASLMIIILFTAGEADYYEDVLLSTEANHDRLQAAKEGKRQVSTRRVKVREKETGLNRGKGANAIFYKHMLEMRRSSRTLFVDSYTIAAAAGAGLLCHFVNKPFTGYIILGILAYILFFFTVMGRMSNELLKPFVYMIPEKSIQKLLAASATGVLKPLADGIIIFSVVTVVLKTSVIENLFLALTYAATGALFVCFTILCQKFLGGQPNKLISSLLGVALFGLVVTPGIVASTITIMLLPSSLIYLGVLPYIFCCIVVCGFIFFICQDIFENVEFNGKM